MKRNFLFSAFFLFAISSFVLGVPQTCLSGVVPVSPTGADVFLNVNKTAVVTGELLTGKAVIKMYSTPDSESGFFVRFGDGSNDLEFECLFNPDAPGDYGLCEQKFAHIYENPNTYVLFLRTPTIGSVSYFRSVFITVTKAPVSTFATTIRSALGATSTAGIIRKIAEKAYWIIASLFVLIIMIGGFFIIASAGDPNRVATGRKIITYAIIGFAIAAVASGIIELIRLILGVRQ